MDCTACIAITTHCEAFSAVQPAVPPQASEPQQQQQQQHYGSFLQPPGAGLDSAADQQHFGSPAIPGGGLGDGLQVSWLAKAKPALCTFHGSCRLGGSTAHFRLPANPDGGLGDGLQVCCRSSITLSRRQC